MAISFNVATTTTADTSVSIAPVIPAGVLVNDVMLLVLLVFTEVATVPTISFSGAGGTWTLVPMTTGPNPAQSTQSTVWANGWAYYRVATAGDPGATLTISAANTSGAGTTWMAVSISSYTGANTTSPIDVAGGVGIEGAGIGVTLPSPVTTTVANDWAVSMYAAGLPIGATVTGPAGTTQRANLLDASGIGSGIWDSNGSFTAGTNIGGGQFSAGAGGTDWWTAFVVGIAPPSGVTLGPQVNRQLPNMPVYQVFRAGQSGAGSFS